jgi:hypothetical protein
MKVRIVLENKTNLVLIVKGIRGVS